MAVCHGVKTWELGFRLGWNGIGGWMMRGARENCVGELRGVVSGQAGVS